MTSSKNTLAYSEFFFITFIETLFIKKEVIYTLLNRYTKSHNFRAVIYIIKVSFSKFKATITNFFRPIIFIFFSINKIFKIIYPHYFGFFSINHIFALENKGKLILNTIAMILLSSKKIFSKDISFLYLFLREKITIIIL